MGKNIKLYYKPGTCALAIHIALIWGCADYELEQIELGSSELKKINPLGSVPALVFNGKVMTEAGSLLKFVAAKFKAIDMIGGIDPESNQEVDQWLSFLGSELHKSYSPIFATARYTTKTDEDSLAAVRAAAVERMKVVYNVIEKHLEGKSFMANNVKTVVDAYLYVFNTWMPATQSLKIEDYPNMQKHFNTMSKDDAVVRARKEQGI